MVHCPLHNIEQQYAAAISEEVKKPRSNSYGEVDEFLYCMAMPTVVTVHEVEKKCWSLIPLGAFVVSIIINNEQLQTRACAHACSDRLLHVLYHSCIYHPSQ